MSIKFYGSLAEFRSLNPYGPLKNILSGVLSAIFQSNTQFEFIIFGQWHIPHSHLELLSYTG